jgi:hypothetical protein
MCLVFELFENLAGTGEYDAISFRTSLVSGSLRIPACPKRTLVGTIGDEEYLPWHVSTAAEVVSEDRF